MELLRDDQNDASSTSAAGLPAASTTLPATLRSSARAAPGRHRLIIPTMIAILSFMILRPPEHVVFSSSYTLAIASGKCNTIMADLEAVVQQLVAFGPLGFLELDENVN